MISAAVAKVQFASLCITQSHDVNSHKFAKAHRHAQRLTHIHTPLLHKGGFRDLSDNMPVDEILSVQSLPFRSKHLWLEYQFDRIQVQGT